MTLYVMKQPHTSYTTFMVVAALLATVTVSNTSPQIVGAPYLVLLHAAQIAFNGPLLGSTSRPFGGRLSDRIGESKGRRTRSSR
jgi:nitrate/nitrite transporter NarK